MFNLVTNLDLVSRSLRLQTERAVLFKGSSLGELSRRIVFLQSCVSNSTAFRVANMLWRESLVRPF